MSSYFESNSTREIPPLYLTVVKALSSTKATLATYLLDLLHTRLAAHPAPVSVASTSLDISRP